MKRALLVIDVQNYFTKKDKNARNIVMKIRSYLKKKCGDYDIIFFTVFKNNSKSPLWKISGWRECTEPPDAELCKELKEFSNKRNTIYKNILSATKVPKILNTLKNKGIKEVHICGFDTDCCLLATAFDIFDTGIKPVYLENLSWSTSEEKLHKPAIAIAKRNIGFVRRVQEF